MNTIEKLKKCIEQIDNMSQEEFDSIVAEKKINKYVECNTDEFKDSGFRILFSDEVLSDEEISESNNVEEYIKN